MFGFSEDVTSTMTVVGVASANFVLLFHLCEKWNVWKIAMMGILVLLFVGAICLAGNVFYLVIPPWEGILLLAGIVVLDAFLYMCNRVCTLWYKIRHL